MADEYEIRSHEYADVEILVLAPVGKKDFLEKLRDNPKKRGRASLIAIATRKVQERGVSKCIGRSNFVRMLDEGLCLAELKVAGKVIRVMCHCPAIQDDKLVLLFDFDAHKGKSGKIPKSAMEKGRRLAKEAARLAKEDD